MRILHLPIVICNQAWLMSRGLRRAGMKSDYMILDDNEAGWILPSKPDYDLKIYHRPKGENPIKVLRDTQKFFLKSLFKYDIFHYHSNIPLFDNFLDLKVLRSLGKKIFVSYWGCDIRQKSINSKYKFNTCDYCNFDCKENFKNKRKLAFVKYANRTIVHSPELLEYSPKDSLLIPTLIDTDFWVPDKIVRKKKSLKIFHSIGNQLTRGDVKGTSVIEEAIKRLRKEGMAIEYVKLTETPNTDQKKFYLEADFVIEQLRYGIFGLTALEAMALEKPVITYVRPDLLKHYPALPIINANETNIYHKIKWLISHRSHWGEIGKKGRQYTIQNHKSTKIIKKLIKIYESY